MSTCCAWFAAIALFAQPVNRIISARSFSGQFVAQELRDRTHRLPAPQGTRVPMGGGMGFLIEGPPPLAGAATDKIPLEPALLVVSCERIKDLFLTQMGLNDQWRGRVDLGINKSFPEDRQPVLTAIHNLDGWTYELELPKNIRPEVLLRAVIQTLFTELANRNATGHATDMPFWLVDGFSAHLRAFNLPTFILRPDVQSAGNQKLSIQGMEPVRLELRDHTALSFQQLSWPDASDASGRNAALYQSCAQLFFEQLLNFKDGQACFQRMLNEMPRHMNWQTAFLIGFHSHFGSLLDVEKWWEVNCVSFTSSDLTGPRTARECWHRLQDALDVPVEVNLGPARTTEARITLQEAIMEWNTTNGLTAVQRSASDLRSLQWFNYQCDLTVDAAGAAAATMTDAQRRELTQEKITQELSPLVVRYRIVLLNYLNQSQNLVVKAVKGHVRISNVLAIKKETVRQLDVLDQEREAIRTKLIFASAGADVSSLDGQTQRGALKKARPGR